MIKNYLLTIFRSFRKQKSYWVINSMGLAAGLSCCLLIVVYVHHETSFDGFHRDNERIFRLATQLERPGRPTQAFASTPLPLAEVLLTDVPGVQASVRLKRYRFFVENSGKRFHEEKFYFAGARFFDIFSFPLAAGHPDEALRTPFSVVLTSATAKKYFGDQDPLGQIITVEDTVSYTVTGVLAEAQMNSHLAFDFLASFGTLERLGLLGQYPWWSFNLYTYVKLSESVAPDRFLASTHDAVRPYLASSSAQYGTEQIYSLQPISDVYLDSKLQFETGVAGDRTYVQLFMAVAVLVLIIACVNFVNLTLSRSTGRGKEVAMRKTLGASRRQVFRQFLSESLVMTGLAYIMALFFVMLSLPYFSRFLDKALSLDLFADVGFLLISTSIVLLMGLAAGFYPAFVLSAHSPATSMKAGLSFSRKTRLRRSLIMLQYVASALLLIATFTVYRQLSYMQGKNLGFVKEQILVMDLRGNSGMLGQNYEVLKQSFVQEPDVYAASASSVVPGMAATRIVFRPDDADEVETQSILTLITDHDFTGTYEIEMAAGRQFSREFSGDALRGFILNESAVASLGWGDADAAIGKNLTWGWPGKSGQVVGVVRDFHQLGLRNPIEPILIHIQPSWFNYLSLRISTQDLSNTLARLQQIWQRNIPNRPFNFAFLDQSFARQYQTDVSAGRVFGLFTVLAIILAGVGLLSLTLSTVEQRTREIAVRKTLGASALQIWRLLATPFVTMVFLAIVIAGPIGYLAMREWMAGFAFHTQLAPHLFLLSAGALLFSALLTTAFHTAKASRTNPIHGLRSE